MNNAAYGKVIENVRNDRNTEFVTTEARRNYLVSEPTFYMKTFFSEYLLAIEITKCECS